MRFASPGLSTPAILFSYLKDAFDVLYEEGASNPRCSFDRLHWPGELAARGASRALQRFFWITSRGPHDLGLGHTPVIDIARHLGGNIILFKTFRQGATHGPAVRTN